MIIGILVLAFAIYFVCKTPADLGQRLEPSKSRGRTRVRQRHNEVEELGVTLFLMGEFNE